MQQAPSRGGEVFICEDLIRGASGPGAPATPQPPPAAAPPPAAIPPSPSSPVAVTTVALTTPTFSPSPPAALAPFTSVAVFALLLTSARPRIHLSMRSRVCVGALQRAPGRKSAAGLATPGPRGRSQRRQRAARRRPLHVHRWGRGVGALGR